MSPQLPAPARVRVQELGLAKPRLPMMKGRHSVFDGPSRTTITARSWRCSARHSSSTCG